MTASGNPFDLDNEAAYRAWRERKLSQKAEPPVVAIQSSEGASEAEARALADSCNARNFVLFRFRNPPADPQPALQALASRFGLRDIDANLCAEDSGLTEITVKETATDNRYIPYTDKPIGWHTDGYYNPMNQQIQGMLLYCKQPAMQGGINGLLDHDIAYIRLRDQNPDWIRALMDHEAFTIPANFEGGKEIRPATIGPVFTFPNEGTRLHMRYSARQRNVQWKDDPLVLAAAAALRDILDEDPFALELKLQAGEGILSNNILHRRSGFTDSPDPALKRVYYRARYHDPVIY